MMTYRDSNDDWSRIFFLFLVLLKQTRTLRESMVSFLVFVVNQENYEEVG